MAQHGKDVWASGDAYEPYVGRWSRLVAREFLRWLDLPPDRNWLDIGCGTGALSKAILDNASPRHVTGIDPSNGFVAFARHVITERRATFEVGNAEELPVSDGYADATVSGLVLNFVSDQPKAVREMKRATRAGGVVAAYVWDYAGEMLMMRHFWDAAVALDASAIPLDEGRRFPVCRPEPLANLFCNAELDGVAVRPIDVPTIFKDFDDYWTPFLGGEARAPGYCVSLAEDRRAALRDRIRMTLQPSGGDGSIHLIARAWAVRGTVR
jgi:SAM-dependent methyltransferase